MVAICAAAMLEHISEQNIAEVVAVVNEFDGDERMEPFLTSAPRPAKGRRQVAFCRGILPTVRTSAAEAPTTASEERDAAGPRETRRARSPSAALNAGPGKVARTEGSVAPLPALPPPPERTGHKRVAGGYGSQRERASAWLTATFGAEWGSLLHPNYNTTISACRKSKQWRRARTPNEEVRAHLIVLPAREIREKIESSWTVMRDQLDYTAPYRSIRLPSL